MAKRTKKQIDAIRKKMVEYLNDCIPVKVACQSCGITYQTHLNWMSKGADGNKEYEKYYEDLHRAAADGIIQRHRDVMAGSPGWQAQAWILERTQHMYYAKKDQPTITADVKTTTKEKLEKDEPLRLTLGRLFEASGN